MILHDIIKAFNNNIDYMLAYIEYIEYYCNLFSDMENKNE